MTNEELLAAIQAANKPLVEKLNAIETELATVKNAKQPSTATGDVDEALKQVSDQKEAEKQVAVSNVKRAAKIDAYTVQLAAKTKTPEKLVRAKLTSYKTDEGMDEYFKNAMKSTEEDVKLGIEREHGDEPDLEAEYKAFKELYPENKQPFSEYKRLAKSLTREGMTARKERHDSRGVTSVKEGVEAFA